MLKGLTDAMYEQEIVKSEKPAIILFTSGWCTLCEDMISIMEHASSELGEKADFFTCNIDENKVLRIKFAVAALPTVVFVSDGNKTVLFDSITTPEAFLERVEYMLDGGEAPNTRPLR